MWNADFMLDGDVVTVLVAVYIIIAGDIIVGSNSWMPYVIHVGKPPSFQISLLTSPQLPLSSLCSCCIIIKGI